MFLGENSRWLVALVLTVVSLQRAFGADSFRLHYEGVIGGMVDARLCYDSPFSFLDLEGIHWYLGVDESGDQSCLTGTHPEAHSSLWQISPDGQLWGKRQGSEFALVSNEENEGWKVFRFLEFPAPIQSPAECLLWMGNDGLYVVDGNRLWSADTSGDWSVISNQIPELNAYRSRGFVQSQNFVYSWSDTSGILIDKRTGKIVSFEQDRWPEMLVDFEILGATWRIEGDYVEVVNGEDMMQFDFARKALLSHQTIYAPRAESFIKDIVEGVSVGISWRWLVVASTLFVLAVVVKIGRRRYFNPKLVGKVLTKSNAVDSQNVSDIDLGFSDSFLEIVNWPNDIITMEEFDDLAHGGESLSPESQRARRSKLFREVNAESKLVMGYDLLLRERDPNDRRKVRYRRQALPPRIQRIVQAIRLERQSVPEE